MSLTFEYNGKVDDNGVLKIWQRERMLQEVQAFKNKEVSIVIKEKGKTRSNRQLRYLHGVVIPVLSEGFRNVGHYFNNTQVYRWVMSEYFTETYVNEDTGEVIEIPLSMKEGDGGVTTKMFNEKLGHIQQYASENLGVYIPDPGEQTQVNF